MKCVLAVVVFAVAGLSGCGSPGSSGASWDQVQKTACEGSGYEVIDHAAHVEKELRAQGMESVIDSAAPLKEADGLVEERSCGGHAPFINRYKSDTAADIWIKDQFLAKGCSGSVVASDDWIVSDIRDTDTADRLVKLGGELVDC